LVAPSNQAAVADEDEARIDSGKGRWGHGGRNPVFHWVFKKQHDIPAVACYLSYFGLAFFALRWWRMADPQRPQRFSLFPVLAAGFWAYVLLFLWPWPETPSGVIALVMTSVIVQLVSPWEEPPPPKAKRLRLHYA